MVKCSFCGKELEKGTGTIFIKKDTKLLYFDSKKCEKNMLKLKRKPINVKWTSKIEK